MMEARAIWQYAETSRVSVHPRHIQQVNVAWRQTSGRLGKNLAQELGPSLLIIIKNLFLKGEPVNRSNFIRICQILELNWREIAGLDLHHRQVSSLPAQRY